MKVNIQNTIEQYEKLYSLEGNKEDFFRFTMMKPFEKMWDTIHVPLKANQPQGYDVITATKMLGYLDVSQTEIGKNALEQLKQKKSIDTASQTLQHCVNFLQQNQLEIKAEEIVFGLFIADPLKLELQKGYTGFGGIPGFIQIMLYPNSYNMKRIPALIAHEFHHNIRFSYFDWNHGNVTVGDYLIIEGLADSFAKELYGKKCLGPWITAVNHGELNYSKEVIKDALYVKGFSEVSCYMFGDTIAKEQGYSPVGLPPFAGYAIGYEIVQSFMKENNLTIKEATLLKTDEIINNSKYFE